MRPVAPQIRSITTEDDFKKFLSEADHGARQAAEMFMRLGTSRWLDAARSEGWSDVLRHLVYQLCRRRMIEQGYMPDLELLNRLTINAEDYRRFKNLGHKREVHNDISQRIVGEGDAA